MVSKPAWVRDNLFKKRFKSLNGKQFFVVVFHWCGESLMMMRKRGRKEERESERERGDEEGGREHSPTGKCPFLSVVNT